MFLTLRHNTAALIFSLLTLSLFSNTASAALDNDITSLNNQALTLEAHLQSIQFDSSDDSICGTLVEANTMARALLDSIVAVDDSLAAPLQVDADVLNAIDNFSATVVRLANESVRLSVDIDVLSSTMNMITIKDGLSAMLQLSSDIGTMADRIGEMSDKILVMSDNIGVMADRILLTQELQNQNVELTINSVLQTQTNMLSLVSAVDDSTYDLSFDSIIIEGNLLAARMAAVAFSPWTLKSQLRSVRDDVNAFMGDVKAVEATLINDSSISTLYISYDALIKLGNMSLMLNSLAAAIDGYVIAISGLQAMVTSSSLSDAMNSMLQISADIGGMSNSILQMADQILVMSDNIGMQADQILLTQQAMNLNVASTQTAILAAQQMAIGIIAARNL